MNEVLDERIEIVIGRLARVLLVATIAGVSAIVGAAVFITRIDMRLAFVEEMLPTVIEAQEQTNAQLAALRIENHRLGIIMAEQERLQLQIDRVECIQRGEKSCH
jgi:hypothetical protein